MTQRPFRRRGRLAGPPAAVFYAGLFAVLLALPWCIESCSRGNNSLLNPGTNRQGLEAVPETLLVGEPRADRSARVQVRAGFLDTLTLARTDSVETILFFRFGSLPDTVGITQVQFALRMQAPEGSDLRIDAYAVDSTSSWTESSIRWSNQPVLAPLLSTSSAVTPSPTDTARFQLYPGAVVIPHEAILWIQSWKRNPSLGGLALKISGSSPPGTLRILSREAAVYDSAGAAVLNPRMRFIKGLGYDAADDRAPTEDAMVYRDTRPPIAGSDPSLLVSQWLPTRALFRFHLLPLLDRLPRGVAINRARLYLAVESYAAEDTFELGISESLGDWGEGAEPDTIGSGATTDLFSIPQDLVSSDLPGSPPIVALDIGSIVQQHIVSAPSGLKLTSDYLDVMVRIVGEGRSPRRIHFYSREAGVPELRPWLELIYSAPSETRWNGPEAVR